MSSSTAGRFGKLWGRGYESFSKSSRRILSVKGSGALTYLQGLVTADLTKPPEAPKDYPTMHQAPLDDDQIEEFRRYEREMEADAASDGSSNNPQEGPPPSPPPPPPITPEDPGHKVEFNQNLWSTCFLDNKGRILTDALLWKFAEDEYLIDCPAQGNVADQLMAHLKTYKLRRTKVTLSDRTDEVSSHVIFGSLNAQGAPPGFVVGLDPRHPTFGMRVLSDHHTNADFAEMMRGAFPHSNGNYEVMRRLAGVAEGIELQGKTALECNQEWLNAVSFSKGCYLGQELTARSMHTGVIRKRVMPVMLVEKDWEIPKSWATAQQVQEARDAMFAANVFKRLPQFSAASLGGLMSMMMGALDTVDPVSSLTAGDWADKAEEEEAKREQVQKQAELLLEKMEGIERGDKIVDTQDDKTIGQVLSLPAPGVNVVLAQMRLDRVGMTTNKSPWKRTNKIRLGDQEYRYLPYLPIWWPIVDPETGKGMPPEQIKSVESPEQSAADEEAATNAGRS